jgi:hypothetical protein
VALLLLEVLLLRPAQPNNPLDFGAGVDDVAEEVEFRLSQEGRKPDTRCMLGGEATRRLSVVAVVARAMTGQRE